MKHGNFEPENKVFLDNTPKDAKVLVEQDPIKAHVDALSSLIERQGGQVNYLTCSNSAGRQSKKIVIEYDVCNKHD